MATDDVFPPRNLPGLAERWGRAVETRIRGIDQLWEMAGQRTSGGERSSSSSAEQMADQIKRITAAYGELPHVDSATGSATNFALAAGWNTVASLNLTDGGKSSRNILARGNVVVNDPGSGTASGTFSWPFPLSDVTSEYGPRSGRFHEGIDFSGSTASPGAAIPAAGGGTIYAKDYSSGFGNYVIIYHGVYGNGGWRLYTLYAHMVNPSVWNVGQAINWGDTVGYVGNTGNSFGAHLHFETHQVSPGGSITWDNLNPSYDSNRTARNPREFMDAWGGGTGPTYDTGVRCRLLIGGVASLVFGAQKNTFQPPNLPYAFFPVFGRTYTGSGPVNVQLQVHTDGGLPAISGNTGVISAQGIFT